MGGALLVWFGLVACGDPDVGGMEGQDEGLEFKGPRAGRPDPGPPPYPPPRRRQRELEETTPAATAPRID